MDLIFMYKEDLALNNQLWLICHKTQTKRVNFPVVKLNLNNIDSYFWPIPTDKKLHLRLIFGASNSKKSVRINISLLPNPSARAGYNTRSIFKRSLTG